jgi:two-component system CheB/CheR fusion protein
MSTTITSETGSEDSPSPLLYVGIGASAGGLEALDAFFENTPPDTGMAFVVVQHLSPDYKSLMVDLLSKRTSMPVHRATDGDPVLPNSVYLIPPKKHLKIFQGRLQLSDVEPSKGLNLPIDIFLQSLAEDQNDKAVAVILSGTGSDGTRGVRQVKQVGGVVVVQDAESARFDGMPRSALSTGHADFVLPPEEMPERLVTLLHPAGGKRLAPSPVPEEGLDRVFALLRERNKVDFSHYKPSTVARRIERRMQFNQVEGLDDYVRLLESHPNEVTSLYRELLIGVTAFFRDPELFEQLEREWLPRLLEDLDVDELRFWVAACSTGEEAYSLAFIVHDALERSGRRLPVKIFATDVDQHALVKASAGVYPGAVSADIPQHFRQKYIQGNGSEVRINRAVRESVVFARHDILKDPPFTNIALLSCRNLLIYFQPEAQAKVLEFFNFSLMQQGLLVLGSSESIGEHESYFETVDRKWKAWRSRGIRQPLRGLASLTRPRGLSSPRNRFVARATRPLDDERLLERVLFGLTTDYVPTLVVVNERLELLHSFGDATRFFKVPSGRVQLDVTRMAVRELAIPLATGIQRVLDRGEEVRYTNIRLPEASCGVQMHIKAVPGKKGQPTLIAIVLRDTPNAKTDLDSPAADLDLDKEAAQHIADLEQELQFTKENLQASIEELETANEELQASNEELLASNEELQSTNEELQSVNEELHTVNMEHQRKIMELTELTNDLDNLLAASGEAALFFDENLELRRFSRTPQGVVPLSDHDYGRSIHTLEHQLGEVDIAQLARQVQRDAQIVERRIRQPDGRVSLLRMRPYQVAPNTYVGILITITDVTALQRAHEATSRAERHLVQATLLAKVGFFEFDTQTAALEWSPELHKLHHRKGNRQPTLDEAFGYLVQPQRRKLRERFDLLTTKGGAFDELVALTTEHGHERAVRIIASAAIVDGQVVNVSGAYQDVSQLTQVEQALADTQIRYDELLENTSSGMIVFEPLEDGHDFIITDINRAAEAILRVPNASLAGISVRTAFPDDAGSELAALVRRVWATRTPVRFPVIGHRRDDQQQWLEHALYPLPSGQVVVLFDDVTDRVQRQQAEA